MTAVVMNALVVALLAVATVQQASGASPSDASLPKSIGIVGVGTIGSALARGILSSPPGHLPFVPKFVLYDKDATKTQQLKRAFPDSVTVAADDQGVLEGADCIVLALPGSVAVEVIQSLSFRTGQSVISLIAAVNITQLQHLLGPGVDSTVAVPLPAIATRQGATLGYPAKQYAEAVFGALGSYIAAPNEAQFKAMGVAGTLMGDFYMRQLTVQQWMVSNNVDVDKAAAFIGAIFSTIAADSSQAGPNTFAEKVAEQTPGGLNEMVWKEQAAAGVYSAVNKSLDSVYHRHD